MLNDREMKSIISTNFKLNAFEGCESFAHSSKTVAPYYYNSIVIFRWPGMPSTDIYVFVLFFHIFFFAFALGLWSVSWYISESINHKRTSASIQNYIKKSKHILYHFLRIYLLWYNFNDYCTFELSNRIHPKFCCDDDDLTAHCLRSNNQYVR